MKRLIVIRIQDIFLVGVIVARQDVYWTRIHFRAIVAAIDKAVFSINIACSAKSVAHVVNVNAPTSFMPCLCCDQLKQLTPDASMLQRIGNAQLHQIHDTIRNNAVRARRLLNHNVVWRRKLSLIAVY